MPEKCIAEQCSLGMCDLHPRCSSFMDAGVAGSRAAAHLLAVPNDLLDLSAVDLLGPAALCVQNSSIDEDHWICVHLEMHLQ